MFLAIKSMMMYENNNIHLDSLETGRQFQDFVMNKLSSLLGISVSVFSSKKYQFEVGESIQGIEIKYDARSTGDCTYYECKATGNVAIEVAEKKDKLNKYFMPSGIYSKDNTWLYIVGNYNTLWFFAKKHLILMHKSNKYKTLQTLPTIKTMLLPIDDADKYCVKKITITT